MARFLKRRGTNIHVDGFHLLGLIEKLLHETRLDADLEGDGTAAHPYVMTTAADWIARWRASTREDIIYYKVAGRLITKSKRIYIGDAGPAYLKAANILEAACKAFLTRYDRLPRLRTGPLYFGDLRSSIQYTRRGAHSVVELNLILSTGTPALHWTGADFAAVITAAAKRDGSASNDPVDFVNVDDQVHLRSWIGKNSHHDPEYQLLAQRVVDPGLIYEQSRTDLIAGGGAPATVPWNTILKSPIIARSIRNLLKGEALSVTKDYSRFQFLLPVTAVAIFHAEPARNGRAWPINLMVLDLAEASVANFTWDAILWHPLAIARAATTGVGLAIPGDIRIEGPIGNGGDQPRKIGQITNTLKLHLVGGLLPASPTKGGEIGGNPLFKPAKPLHPNAVLHGAIQGPGAVNNTPFDFIHQKEIDVVFKWLLKFSLVRNDWEVVADVNDGVILTDQIILKRMMPGDNMTSTMLNRIATIISNRIESLDAM